MRIAIPVTGGLVSPHFGRCEEFLLIDVEGGEVKNRFSGVPPSRERGAIPRWLNEQGADVIIASGMGARAQSLFNEQGVQVVLGVAGSSPDEVVDLYLKGALEAGENVCEH
jgi:ATP-binding protein involved in chromosome partitioning